MFKQLWFVLTASLCPVFLHAQTTVSKGVLHSLDPSGTAMLRVVQPLPSGIAFSKSDLMKFRVNIGGQRYPVQAQAVTRYDEDNSISSAELIAKDVSLDPDGLTEFTVETGHPPAQLPPFTWHLELLDVLDSVQLYMVDIFGNSYEADIRTKEVLQAGSFSAQVKAFGLFRPTPESVSNPQGPVGLLPQLGQFMATVRIDSDKPVAKLQFMIANALRGPGSMVLGDLFFQKAALCSNGHVEIFERELYPAIGDTDASVSLPGGKKKTCITLFKKLDDGTHHLLEDQAAANYVAHVYPHGYEAEAERVMANDNHAMILGGLYSWYSLPVFGSGNQIVQNLPAGVTHEQAILMTKNILEEYIADILDANDNKKHFQIANYLPTNWPPNVGYGSSTGIQLGAHNTAHRLGMTGSAHAFRMLQMQRLFIANRLNELLITEEGELNRITDFNGENITLDSSVVLPSGYDFGSVRNNNFVTQGGSIKNYAWDSADDLGRNKNGDLVGSDDPIAQAYQSYGVLPSYFPFMNSFLSTKNSHLSRVSHSLIASKAFENDFFSEMYLHQIAQNAMASIKRAPLLPNIQGGSGVGLPGNNSLIDTFVKESLDPEIGFHTGSTQPCRSFAHTLDALAAFYKFSKDVQVRDEIREWGKFYAYAAPLVAMNTTEIKAFCRSDSNKANTEGGNVNPDELLNFTKLWMEALNAAGALAFANSVFQGPNNVAENEALTSFAKNQLSWLTQNYLLEPGANYNYEMLATGSADISQPYEYVTQDELSPMNSGSSYTSYYAQGLAKGTIQFSEFSYFEKLSTWFQESQLNAMHYNLLNYYYESQAAQVTSFIALQNLGVPHE